jgi:hypothetical protein
MSQTVFLLAAAVVAATWLPAPPAEAQTGTQPAQVPRANGPRVQPNSNPSSCVEIEIGGERSNAFDCWNRKLRQEVDRVQPTLNQPAFGATSPDTRIGVANQPAVQQQYGRNYGVSPFPQRPSAPTYINRR